jgi:hypothetical protein
MPFGIIDAPFEGKLPGTELLVDDEQEDIVDAAEARQLKRVVVKVKLNLTHLSRGQGSLEGY